MEQNSKSTPLTRKALFLKAANYCAYQERTQNEVRTKLLQLGADFDTADQLICDLILESFLNEERYAKVFAGGKFRTKQWGRYKIAYELKKKGISTRNISTGLKEITDEEYLETIYSLIKKRTLPKNQQDYNAKAKLAQYIINKGFESNLVWEAINELLP